MQFVLATAHLADQVLDTVMQRTALHRNQCMQVMRIHQTANTWTQAIAERQWQHRRSHALNRTESR